MKVTPETYQQHRRQLLAEITSQLSNDARFAAAWLTGSLGRNESDEFSDIDISIAIYESHAQDFCTKTVQVSAETSAERYALFGQFGKPALIHENNNNAPAGGTFTFVLYSESALMVDWILLPLSKAARPQTSIILFDKAGIPTLPVASVENIEKSKNVVAEQWAFFWMMTAITIKYINRNDGAFATQWIENLHHIVNEVKRHLNREAWSYTHGSLSKLQATRENQIESIKELCDQMTGLKDKVSEFTGKEPSIPQAEIELLLSLIESKKS